MTMRSRPIEKVHQRYAPADRLDDSRVSARHRLAATLVAALVGAHEDFVYWRVARGLARFVGQQVLLRDISDVLTLRVLGVEVVKRLILRGTHLGRDRPPPFLRIGEGRIDIVDHAAKGIDAVLDDLADGEFRGARLHRTQTGCSIGTGSPAAPRLSI